MFLFFLNLLSCIFLPARMWPEAKAFAALPEGILGLAPTGFFARMEEEEKEAAKTVMGAAILRGIEVVVAVEGRRRHLKLLGTDIVASVPRIRENM